MAKNVFNYPGGKTRMCDWILEHFPDHNCYVEVFGGSGAVIANKNRSKVEVYNDKDGDIVHFFTTLRDRGEELAEWLRYTPFSRELHSRYATAFYDGVRSDDDIERAGRFFYLRETQFMQKYDRYSGFRCQVQRNGARAYDVKIDRLEEWKDRFREVQIECLDYADLVERYDREDTLFYCDPPYMDEGDDLYTHGEFDHDRFVDELLGCEGYWIVSYTRVPDRLRSNSVEVVEQDRLDNMDKGQREEERVRTERLVMNFDPEEVRKFNTYHSVEKWCK